MKSFTTVHDKDIFSHPIEPHGEYALRPTVKVILIDKDNNVALMKARGHYLLPGGGVEAGEDKIAALKREILEEVGCQIEQIEEFGVAHQYRNKSMTHYEIHFFTAHVAGEKGTPTTTQEDELKDVEIYWCSREKVLELLASQSNTVDEHEYALCFNTRSQYEIFQKFYTLTK